MFNFIRKRMNKKGFTLVELLVVIAVLGIIAGIAIPRMSGVTDSFKEKADAQTAENLFRQVQVRIQIGDIKLPTDSSETRITLTAEPANTTGASTYFGEDFTAKPQTEPEGSFYIGVTADNILIYTTKTADGSTKSSEVKLLDKAHGGAIK